jgi:hypothetical protein
MVFLQRSTTNPHIVKLMILVTDPIGSSLLLLSSVRAKSLYIDTLFLPAESRSGFTFLKDSQV